MDKGWLFVALIGIAVIGSGILLTPALAGREMSIPPTNAFNTILTDWGTYRADRHDSQLIAPKPPYAQISDLTTQACADLGVASNVTLSSNDGIYHISHSISSDTHEIVIQENGTYQIIAAPQVGEATSQADGLHNFWMMKNGAQVPNTNIKSHITVQIGGDETVMETFNWVGRLYQNDIVYFQQSCTDPDIGIIFTSAAVPPNTPSVIVSIAKLNW